jgi:hypothetical protein
MSKGCKVVKEICCAGRACTGKRVFFADAAVPPAYSAAVTHAGSRLGPRVLLRPGDYVAVEVVEGTASALRARALARTSIAEFVALEGSTVPLPGTSAAGDIAATC